MNFVFLPKGGSINFRIDSLTKAAIKECRIVLLIQKLPDPQFRIQITGRQSQYFLPAGALKSTVTGRTVRAGTHRDKGGVE